MFVHVVVAVTWCSYVWIGVRHGVMTSLFHKIYGLAVHMKTQGCHFQIYTVLKKCVFTLPKRRIHLDETPIWYKILIYTAKRISVWTGPKANFTLHKFTRRQITVLFRLHDLIVCLLVIVLSRWLCKLSATRDHKLHELTTTLSLNDSIRSLNHVLSWKYVRIERKELDWQAIWPIRMRLLCAAAAIRHLARQQRPIFIEIHVKIGWKINKYSEKNSTEFLLFHYN